MPASVFVENATDTAHAAAATHPLIGLFPRAEERAANKGHALFTQTPLMRGVQAAGGIALTLSPTDDPAVLDRYLEVFDGFLIPGGGDIDPACYGDERCVACGPQEDFRDDFERALVPRILEADKPLLGICRGNQLLNVVMGGTLWQDIPSQPESTPVALERPLRHMVLPDDSLVHTVDVLPGSLLDRVAGTACGAPAGQDRRAKGADTPAEGIDARQEGCHPWDGARRLTVNSLHHQSVRRVGEGLTVNAYAPDGTVEGLELPGKRFALSVQWHPEFLWEKDAVSFAIMKALVDAARSERICKRGA